MRTFCAPVCLMYALCCGLAAGQTTQPVDYSALELRATEAFNGGDYALALPMLEKLAEARKDQPERVAVFDEQIRVCRANLAMTDPQSTATLRSDVPEETGPRTPHAKPAAGQVLEITIKDLGNFEYDSVEGGGVPEDVIALSGSPVRLRGFMIPMDQADRITQFALVPDLFACCFGQPPQLQHTVLVSTPAGKNVSYFPDEIVVEGVLNVEEKKDDDYIVSLFDLTATSVKPAPR